MNENYYYEILGVEPDATESEIKKAFHHESKQCHPDLYPDDETAEERFKEINEAYQCLSDPDKRKAYDDGNYDPNDVNNALNLTDDEQDIIATFDHHLKGYSADIYNETSEIAVEVCASLDQAVIDFERTLGRCKKRLLMFECLREAGVNHNEKTTKHNLMDLALQQNINQNKAEIDNLNCEIAKSHRMREIALDFVLNGRKKKPQLSRNFGSIPKFLQDAINIPDEVVANPGGTRTDSVKF